MNRVFKTPKGTDLPLLTLRGKQYLEVKYRLIWFREEHPDWAIETQMLNVTETSAYAKAVIKDESGRVISTSHKFENAKGFPDFIEKAETGAIGRALALIGFGTQFCADELDEGARIVDSPVSTKIPKSLVVNKNPDDPGEFEITIGKKYRGMKLRDVKFFELESFVKWLEDQATAKGKPLDSAAHQFKLAVGRYERSLMNGGKP